MQLSAHQILNEKYSEELIGALALDSMLCIAHDHTLKSRLESMRLEPGKRGVAQH